ncbi:MAG: asparagine synthase (glutamine-hydrolyzing) [Gammaproteobacteria bacterium]|nr:asparagine synthase (glutamine-hydrolyzing) [Gammaproteobacteria bacterium]MDE2346133.1 asparagine synthase (glutamine-hydrolyzing) [Gammaproteobacteria bacterium]
MCGIAGFLYSTSASSADGAQRLAMARGMADALKHRGPDDQGAWDDGTGVTLAHRRLSIIDTSPMGHQPMLSQDGRYAITYNGEVYNFVSLRSELNALGCKFRGHSDTEVILAAIQVWGIEQALQRFTGMFSIALWDRARRELKLIRDRLGIKPLYYGWVKGTFVFGSELKAFKAYPGFAGGIDRQALCLYLRHGYIPAPRTIYTDIYKLLPGHLLSVPSGAAGMKDLTDEVYWSLRKVAECGMHDHMQDEVQALEAIEAVLRDAVALRMLSDVPLGAFLSGGVDSSLVVALMQAQSRKPVRTFSIGFAEREFDEAAQARAVARHLGTDHTELYVTPQAALEVIPMLPQMYDEPFADSSQIPTYLVSRLARSSVTVSLSGDGGDELFAGYDRYYRTMEIWRNISRWPLVLRRALGNAVTGLPTSVLQLPAALLQSFTRHEASADRLIKFATLLKSSDIEQLYGGLLGHWSDPEALVVNGRMPEYFLSNESNWAISNEPLENMCFADLNTYLPDDILTKIDRASMAVSLEARVPLLDHRLVEMSWRLPLRMKVRNGTSKWMLRSLLYKYVPRELVERPKMGFGVPIGEWLRGPLRDWADSLLETARLKRENFFDVGRIRRKWDEHVSGKRQWHYLLWDVLMFQAWLEHQ